MYGDCMFACRVDGHLEKHFRSKIRKLIDTGTDQLTENEMLVPGKKQLMDSEKDAGNSETTEIVRKGRGKWIQTNRMDNLDEPETKRELERINER